MKHFLNQLTRYYMVINLVFFSLFGLSPVIKLATWTPVKIELPNTHVEQYEAAVGLDLTLDLYYPVSTDKAAPTPYNDPLWDIRDEELRGRFVLYCVENNVDTTLMYSLINMESGWNKWAVGRPNYDGSRDYGLMQLNDRYYEYFRDMYNEGIEFDMLNPYDNMKIGIAYFADILTWQQVQGDYEKALWCYNWGVGNVNLVLSGHKQVPGVVRQYSSVILNL